MLLKIHFVYDRDYLRHLMRHHQMPKLITDTVLRCEMSDLIDILNLHLPVEGYLVEGLPISVTKRLKSAQGSEFTFKHKMHVMISHSGPKGLYRTRTRIPLDHPISHLIYLNTSEMVGLSGDYLSYQNMIGTLAHELFHAWQYEHGEIYTSDNEVKANIFALAYCTYKHYTYSAYLEEIGEVKTSDGKCNIPDDEYKQLFADYMIEYFW